MSLSSGEKTNLLSDPCNVYYLLSRCFHFFCCFSKSHCLGMFIGSSVFVCGDSSIGPVVVVAEAISGMVVVVTTAGEFPVFSVVTAAVVSMGWSASY